MENVIIVIILAAIVVGIVWYLRKAKKRGEKCVGCPYAKKCGGSCNGGSGHAQTDNKSECQ